MAIVTDPYTQQLNQYLANQSAQAAAPTVSAKNETVSNMDSASFAALSALIQALSGQVGQAGKSQADSLSTAKKGAEGYSKEAAFADSNAVMQAQLRDSLAKILPSLVRASEGAGTSQNSMRALLTQQAGQDAADSAAALGLKASVDYGQIAQGFLQNIAGLTQAGDPVTQALLAALNTAKGVKTSTQSVSSQGKDPNYTSVGGVMGTGNTPMTTPGFGVTGSFGNNAGGWSSYKF